MSSNPLLEAFARHVRDRSRDEALWSRGENLRLSFAELQARVEIRVSRLATDLADDRSPVVLATGNCVAFVENYMALRHLGVTVVAMDGALPYGDQVAACRDLGLRHLLLADRLVDLSEAAGEGGRPDASVPGIGLVKLTSGSTGRPTGACFTDDVLLAGVQQIAEGMDLDHEQRVLMCIPLSHSYGFDNGVLSLLALGTPLILQPSIFPADLVRAVAESQAHFLPLVPPLVRSLGRATWPAELTLRAVVCAGGALLPESARRFRAASGRPVHNFYGSTETGGICYETAPEEPRALGTVGRPLPGVRVDLDASSRVVVRSAANLIGRWGADGVVPIAAASPVRTGDTAEWTTDGRLRLTGRTADILNIGGRKIAAAEVEAALRTLVGVRDAAVVGVDDPARGDRTVAFLVTDDWPLDLSMIPPRLMPREVRQVASLPHTARGKLDRQTLRRMALFRDVT